jgi:hypothetical protein
LHLTLWRPVPLYGTGQLSLRFRSGALQRAIGGTAINDGGLKTAATKASRPFSANCREPVPRLYLIVPVNHAVIDPPRRKQVTKKVYSLSFHFGTASRRPEETIFRFKSIYSAALSAVLPIFNHLGAIHLETSVHLFQ